MPPSATMIAVSPPVPAATAIAIDASPLKKHRIHPPTTDDGPGTGIATMMMRMPPIESIIGHASLMVSSGGVGSVGSVTGSVASPNSVELDSLTDAFAHACACGGTTMIPASTLHNPPPCCHLNLTKIMSHLTSSPNLSSMTTPDTPTSNTHHHNTYITQHRCRTCIPLPTPPPAGVTHATTSTNSHKRRHESFDLSTSTSAAAVGTAIAPSALPHTPDRHIVRVRKSIHATTLTSPAAIPVPPLELDDNRDDEDDDDDDRDSSRLKQQASLDSSFTCALSLSSHTNTRTHPERHSRPRHDDFSADIGGDADAGGDGDDDDGDDADAAHRHAEALAEIYRIECEENEGELNYLMDKCLNSNNGSMQDSMPYIL